MILRRRPMRGSHVRIVCTAASARWSSANASTDWAGVPGGRTTGGKAAARAVASQVVGGEAASVTSGIVGGEAASAASGVVGGEAASAASGMVPAGIYGGAV